MHHSNHDAKKPSGKCVGYSVMREHVVDVFGVLVYLLSSYVTPLHVRHVYLQVKSRMMMIYLSILPYVNSLLNSGTWGP